MNGPARMVSDHEFADLMGRLHKLEARDPYARSALVGIIADRHPSAVAEALTVLERFQGRGER